MNYVYLYLDEFWNMTVEMAPWLLLGFLVAGILKVFLPQQKIDAHLSKNTFPSVIKASLLGIPMPLCSCGVIPTGVSLYKNGASSGATGSFMISTPQTGVDSIMATYALMGWPLALIRPLIALISGIFGGWLMVLFRVPNSTPEESRAVVSSAETGSPLSSTPLDKPSLASKWQHVLQYSFVDMVQDLSKWLLLGLALSALVAVLIPDDFFEQYIGNSSLEILLVLLVSIPIYICATGSIPLATSLILKGISPGAAIVLLMAGPATNMTTLTVIQKAIGKKFMWLYLLSIIVCALAFGMLINFLFPPEWLSSFVHQPQAIHHHFSIVSQLMAIFLFLLIIHALFIKPLYKKNIMIKPHTLALSVEGMTCNHCKLTVENNVRNIQGVDSIEVDLPGHKVYLSGSFDYDQVKDKINDLGYQVME